MISKQEKRLIEACIRGDRRAQSRLYDQYHRRLFGVCLRYAANKQEAEDFLLEGFFRIFRGLSQFNYRSSIYSWMRKVVVNTALMQLRKKHVFNFSMLELQEGDSVTDPDILHQLSNEDLVKVIRKLPRGARIIFNLYAIEGYSHPEIAAEMGISESTSRSQYTRAKKTLRHLLKRDYSSFTSFQ